MSQTLPFVGPNNQAQRKAEPVFIVDRDGNYAGGVEAAASAVANVTTVAATTSSTQLLAANPSRKGIIITNGTDVGIRIRYGSPASLTVYTVALGAGGVFEAIVPYRGIVTAIAVAAPTTANVHVTELV